MTKQQEIDFTYLQKEMAVWEFQIGMGNPKNLILAKKIYRQKYGFDELIRAVNEITRQLAEFEKEENMDIHDKSTLFCRLRNACYRAEQGDDNARDEKATLIALCEDKFGEVATRQALEAAQKFIDTKK